MVRHLLIYTLLILVCTTTINCIDDDENADTCNNEDEDSPLDEFPEYFTEEQLRQGWIVLHVFASVYFLTLLAIICNDYFLPSVECICGGLNLSKDVAAATFMATATSMPEFFTNTVSLYTNSDLGLGTIIGSLMFNTLGVAGMAALAIQKPVQLDWWPIARDCTLYIFNTVILLLLAWNGNISFTGSTIMMGFLALYYVITFNNNKFMPAIRVFIEDKMNCCWLTRYDLTEPPENSAKAQLPVKKEPLNGNGVYVITNPMSHGDLAVFNANVKSGEDTRSHELPSKLFALPRNQSKMSKFLWAYTFPIRFVLTFLIPNPVIHRKWYPLTFFMCIVTIGVNAYLIVWMLTAFSVTVNAPVTVMGLTFLAAGSNMPEAISSIIALRNGENGIGVSNSLGANSLAILLSLGVPWFIKNCIIFYRTGSASSFNIGTNGIEYIILILIVTTIVLFIVLTFSGYRLTKRVGLTLFTFYTILITLQILIVMNVFYPKECP